MKTKVLLVDDDVSVVAALTGVLCSEGYDVIQAFDGHDAVKNFKTVGGASIALLDLCMPVKGGWDTFEQLTAINPLLPTIVITAQPGQYPLAAAAGVAALMEKPLDIPLLLETMRKLLAEPAGVRLARIAGQAPHTLYLEVPDAAQKPKNNPVKHT
jgi:two-component system response regulator HydG